MKTKIIFVRHGETVDNFNKIVQGQRDGKLSKKGILEAKLVGERFKKEKNIDVIFVSDLKRAKDTAKEIIKYHKKTPVFYDPRLRERNYGKYQGLPGHHVRKAIVASKKDYVHFRPKGGESVIDLKNRSRKFFKDILKKYSGKKIMLVTHGGFILTSIIHMFNESHDNFEKYLSSNTGVTIIEFDNNEFKLRKLNCTKHLK